MKLAGWTATGLGLGVFSGFMGGLLRGRSVTEVRDRGGLSAAAVPVLSAPARKG